MPWRIRRLANEAGFGTLIIPAVIFHSWENVSPGKNRDA
jgi:hypothetical protein